MVQRLFWPAKLCVKQYGKQFILAGLAVLLAACKQAEQPQACKPEMLLLNSVALALAMPRIEAHTWDNAAPCILKTC